MMMCKRGLSTDCTSLYQPILSYSNLLGISSRSNYLMILLTQPWCHTFFVIPCSILASLLEQVWLIDVTFSSYICQQKLYFLIVVIRIWFQNINSNIPEQLICFLSVYYCLLRIIILGLLQPTSSQVQCVPQWFQ